MLRKVIWFVLICFICVVWFRWMISCSNSNNEKVLGNTTTEMGVDEDVVFQADEDSGDDGYILEDEDEKDNLSDDEFDTEKDSDSKMIAAAEKILDKEEDLIEKSPEAKRVRKTISRDAIRETSYTSDSSIGYYVITGSFADEVNADRMVERLKDMGYSKAEKIVFDFSQYYSVVSGKYDTESSARSKSLELKNKNINAYVHRMRSKLFGE